jgi:hypothetical protein
VRRFIFFIGVLITPLFSFDNHFIGIVTSTGKVEGDVENVLENKSFTTAGIKTGVFTDNFMAYFDIQHFTFEDDEVNIADKYPTKFNEDAFSVAVGPVFKIDRWYEMFFFLNGVLTIDKFHYGQEKVANHYTEYLSQYQVFFGYEFGLILPTRLNPLHVNNEMDSFFEIGYRSVYRNDSASDSNSESGFDEKEVTPFESINSYFFALNILF